MANEAVIIELGPNGGKPVYRSCLDSTSIEKGTLLVLNDANRVSGATAAFATLSGAALAFGGIAAAEKVANDGSTTIAAYTEGVFDLTASTDTITAGWAVVMSGANLVRQISNGAGSVELYNGSIIGTAEETAAASEVIRVRLKGY